MKGMRLMGVIRCSAQDVFVMISGVRVASKVFPGSLGIV